MATQGQLDAEEAAANAPEGDYPPDNTELKETRRSYKDEAAAEMFKSAGGKHLQASAAGMARALTKQATKLEEFHSSPFTKQNVRTIETTIKAMRAVQGALTEWHYLIYPNQRDSSDQEPDA